MSHELRNRKGRPGSRILRLAVGLTVLALALAPVALGAEADPAGATPAAAASDPAEATPVAADSDPAETTPPGAEAPEEEPVPDEEPVPEEKTPDEEGDGETSSSPVIPWVFLGWAFLFGALGGVVYELIVLQGNIEWPHKTRPEEIPEGGFTHAGARALYDLGILARIIIGAMAAIIVYLVLPVEDGVRLVATSLVAGSAGIAIFRSLQDRMLAALNAAKTDTLAAGMESVDESLAELEALAPKAGGGPAPSIAGGGGGGGGAADVQAKASEIRGQVRALLKVAGRR